MIERTYVQPAKFPVHYNDDYQPARRVAGPGPGVLITSTTTDGSHAPTLDIDFEARLVPSSTPGCYHLFLDRTMSWRRYRKLLKALYKAGIIERGFYKASIKRRETRLATDPDDKIRRQQQEQPVQSAL